MVEPRRVSSSPSKMASSGCHALVVGASVGIPTLRSEDGIETEVMLLR